MSLIDWRKVMGFKLCNNLQTRTFPPSISISKSGMIVISRAAADKFDIGAGIYVRLFFDEDTDLIGIDKCAKTEDGSVKINKTRSFKIKGFFDFFKLDYTDFIGRYEIGRLENHAFVVANLRTPLGKTK